MLYPGKWYIFRLCFLFIKDIKKFIWSLYINLFKFSNFWNLLLVQIIYLHILLGFLCRQFYHLHIMTECFLPFQYLYHFFFCFTSTAYLYDANTIATNTMLIRKFCKKSQRAFFLILVLGISLLRIILAYFVAIPYKVKKVLLYF